MIPVRHVADLEISAASGIVRDGPVLYVVADDELFLDGYLSTGQRARRIPLFEGTLPEDHRERKRLKPDLESLTWLPDGRLLVLGSGSTGARDRGVILRSPRYVDGPPCDPRTIDLRPLYDALRERFAALNIEGVAAAGGRLRLLQRGNGGAENAVIDLDLAKALVALERGTLEGDAIGSIRTVDLGSIDGVPLGFTDASTIDDSGDIAFVAAAEDTRDTYHDGACAGSVLGVLCEDATLRWMDRLEGRWKVEGVEARHGSGVEMVADPDDRSQRAPWLEARWP